MSEISKKRNHRNNAGFTLIEFTVVLALFMIIMGVATDIFLSMLQQQKRILAEQELLSQISYAEEFMSKALRVAVKAPDDSCLGVGTTGYAYLLTHCNNGTVQPCNGIKFINASDSNACEEFYLDDITDPTKPVLKTTRNGLAAQNIISDIFNVKYARFILNGDRTLHFAAAAGTVQPRVTVLLDIKTQNSGPQQEKIIQTTISQRNLK